MTTEAQPQDDERARARRDLYVSLVVFAMMVGLLIWSYQLDPRGRTMPLLAAWAGVVISALDAIGRTDTRTGRWIGMILSDRLDMQKGKLGPVRRLPVELLACLWMVIGIGLVVMFGFLLAIPVYVFAYMLIYGGRSLRQSGITAVVTTGLIWLMFEVMLRYDLYRGILFED